MSKWKEKVSDCLENLSSEIAVNSACALLWGEITMPDSLKEEAEQEMEN